MSDYGDIDAGAEGAGKSLLAEHVSLDQAATLMGVSARHTRRILTVYREEGAAALAHGNRGLRSTNATPETTRAEVLRLARSRYPDANHSHLRVESQEVV